MTKYCVNQEECIGCGFCVGLAPDIFKMDGEKATAIKDSGENAEEAYDSCPVNAIKKSEV